jgi:hypothetical protein
LQVISVDISILPPSYCIEVEGNLRETEEWRLKDPSSVGLSTATAAPAAQLENEGVKSNIQPTECNSINGLAEEEIEDFGDFSAAPEPSSSRPLQSPVPSFYSSSSHTPHATSSQARSSPSTDGSHIIRDARNDKKFREFLAMAAPNVAHALEEQDALESNFIKAEEDEFGEFTDAPVEALERIEDDASLQRDTVAAMAALDSTKSENVVSSSPFLRNLVHLPTSSTAHTNGMAAVAKDNGAVQEYGVVWTSILNIGAEKLEAGRLFWEKSCTTSSSSLSSSSYLVQDAATTTTTDNSTIPLELLEISRAQGYFAALGRIYYVASLVRVSAETLGLLHLVRELDTAWTRCDNAWNSCSTSKGISRPLSSVSHDAAKKLGFDFIINELESLGSVAAVLPSMSLDDFPRMMSWSEGLDSVLLLPLSVITDGGIGRKKGEKEEEREKKATVVEWPEGSNRWCLSAVANFWLGCVSSIPPDLE